MKAKQQFIELDKAWETLPKPICRYYQLSDYVICLAFSHEALIARMSRALEHLLIQARDKVDFTICFWDTAKGGQPLPALDWNLINANGYQGVQEGLVFLHYFESIDALSVIDIEKKQAFYVVKDSEKLPWWVSGSPLQVILHVWLSKQGKQLTHTAAVGNETCALLLTGKGGSGKSTTALACVQAGLNYLGEDYCVLSPSSEPTVMSIYQSAKWERQTRTLFPQFESYIANPIEAQKEKALVFYNDIFPKQIKLQLPIKAIVSLEVGESDEPQLQIIDSLQSTKSLMISSLSQLPFLAINTIKHLHAISLALPCYHLKLGKKLALNIEKVRALLEG